MFDYVIDALNGALVAELPRTPAARHGTASARDELGKMKTFNIETKGGKRVMRDAMLNIETCDFAYRDPVGGKLPGNLASPPWSPAAVSAHTHAATVTTFLRKVLKRNNIDNMGGRVVSTVNCVVKQFEKPPPGSDVWLNAFWDGAQMLYGQERLDDGQLRSMASSLSVVAHELFHGVTGATARLVYLGETGALNEVLFGYFRHPRRQRHAAGYREMELAGRLRRRDPRHAGPDPAQAAQADEGFHQRSADPG